MEQKFRIEQPRLEVFHTYEKIVEIAGEECHMIVLDTSGNEDFNQLRLLSYLNSDVIIVVFSVESLTSYENVTDKWIPEGSAINRILRLCLLEIKLI